MGRRGPKPLSAAEQREALRLADDWLAAWSAGVMSKAEFIRTRFADPKVATRMRGRLDAALLKLGRRQR